jgi:hypothetical protein
MRSETVSERMAGDMFGNARFTNRILYSTLDFAFAQVMTSQLC